MQLVRTLKHKVGSDLSITLISNVSIVILNSVSGILIARLLGPEGRGEFVAAIAWAAIISVVVQIALPQALTYCTALNPQTAGDIFMTAGAIWLLQSVIAVVAGNIAVTFALSQSQALETTQLYLLSVPFTVLSTYLTTIAQGLKRFSLMSLLRLGGTASYILCALVGTLLVIQSAIILIAILLAFQITATLASIGLFWKLIRPAGVVRRSTAGKLIRYGFKSYWGSLAWMANSRLDQLIMSVVVALDQLGQYSIAVAYSGLLFPISGAFATLLFPSVSAGNTQDGRHKIWRTLGMNTVVTFWGSVVLGFASPILIPLLFGPEFVDAIPVAVILLVGTLFLGNIYVLSDGLRGLGLPFQASLGGVVGTVIMVIGLLFFLPPFGIMGAATVSVLSYASVTVTLLAFLMRHGVVVNTNTSATSQPSMEDVSVE